MASHTARTHTPRTQSQHINPTYAPMQEIVTYLLSPEARDLRPLLVRELVAGLDLYGRDRARRAAAALPGLLAFRLPIFGALPALPTPPIFIPGLGVMSVTDAVRCNLKPGLHTVRESLREGVSFEVQQDQFGSIWCFLCVAMSWLPDAIGSFVFISQHSCCHIGDIHILCVNILILHKHDLLDWYVYCLAPVYPKPCGRCMLTNSHLLQPSCASTDTVRGSIPTVAL